MADTKPEVVITSDIWQIGTKFQRLPLHFQARTFHWYTSQPSPTLTSNGNSRWPPIMGTSGPLSAILKFGSRRTSDDVISVTIESGMVENVVVAVGISFISYSVTEIQSTSGVMTAILFSASHLMSTKMENPSIMLEKALFDKLSTKFFKYLWKLYPSHRNSPTWHPFDYHRLSRFPAAILLYFQIPRTFTNMTNSVIHSCDHENMW